MHGCVRQLVGQEKLVEQLEQEAVMVLQDEIWACLVVLEAESLEVSMYLVVLLYVVHEFEL